MSYLDPSRLRYTGGWSAGSSYSANDVVLYNSRLYVCNAAVSNTPVIGSFTSGSSTNISGVTSHITLPAGCVAGDIVLGTVMCYVTTHTLSGVTTLTTAAINNSYTSSTYMYTLTSSDVGSGYFNLTVTATNGYASTVGYAVRGVTVDTAHVASSGSANTPTTPSVTPSGQGYIVHFLAQFGTSSPTQGALSGVTFTNYNNGYAVTAVGYESYSTGASVSRTWTGVNTTEMTSVVPLLSSQGFQTGSFTELSDDNSMHFKGAWSGQSYAVGDVVTYQSKLFVCSAAVAGSVPTFVANAKIDSLSPSAGGTFTLPGTVQAGDVAVMAIGYYLGTYSALAGWTAVGTVQPSNANAHAYIYQTTVTSSQVAAGTIAVGAAATGTNTASAVATFLRNAVAPTSVGAQQIGTAIPAFAPTSASMVLAYGVDATSGSPVTSISMGAYSNTIGAAATSQILVTTGSQTVAQGGSTTATVWTTVPATTGNLSASGVVQINGTGVFPTANFTAVAADNPLIQRVNTVAASGATATLPDVLVDSIDSVTLTANCTVTFPSASAGKSFLLGLTQDTTGSWTVTWPGTVRWAGGTPPTLTIAPAKTDLFQFVCLDGTTWIGVQLGLNF